MDTTQDRPDPMMEIINATSTLGVDVSTCPPLDSGEQGLWEWLVWTRKAWRQLDWLPIELFELSADDDVWLSLVAWFMFTEASDDLNKCEEVVKRARQPLLEYRARQSSPYEAAVIVAKVYEDLIAAI